MGTSEGFPISALREGIARIDGACTLQPVNDAMRDLLASAAHCLDAATIARVDAGAIETVAADGRHWQLRVVQGEHASRWLIAEDVTMRTRAGSAVLELARLRAVAAAAGHVVHDLNNLLNACLGLAAQVRPLLVDPDEARIADDMAAGTQRGAQLVRAVIRMLQSEVGVRETLRVGTVVEEALVLTGKAAKERRTHITFVAGGGPQVHIVLAEAVQALWQTLLGMLECGPADITITLGEGEMPLGGGRPRKCAVVRVRANGIGPEAAATMLDLMHGAPGLITRITRGGGALAGLATATFAMRHLGGDLFAVAMPGGVQADLVLPALG